MKNIGIKNPNTSLEKMKINTSKNVYWNTTRESLVEASLTKGMGVLSDTGALCINTGKFTGRSPKDRYIVKDINTENSVDWGDINFAVSTDVFDNLEAKIKTYFSDKDLYIKDAAAGADAQYRINVRLVAEYPWSAQFANNMFLRLDQESIMSFNPEWTILCAPGFLAEPSIDGVRSENFAIINFTSKKIIIGGTGYTGEIKKGIFSVLNYILPHQNDVLSMHCSANVGQDGDTAIFFGLSGTGKTTLSSDPNRALIGDDEHGWSDDSVFNFEGGCYAKCIDLSQEQEPDIFNAIKHGAILENIAFFDGTRKVDFTNVGITQNTRVSYPIDYIDNAQPGSIGGNPTNIFFLTADAFGVLPPISKLTEGQAMYHFISGYTAKVAGTEEGVVEPEATFSACFGAPFMPLHPTKYAEMLGKKMSEHKVNIWLVNTGWTGGEYGVGNRIKLRYTRAMITAALEGKLDDVSYDTMEVFGLQIPSSCHNVPTEILNPMNTWDDKNAYQDKANYLAELFTSNFIKYEAEANEDIINAAPKVLV